MCDVIYKQGWLQKRGEHIKTWRSRYFILKNDCNFLGYNNRPFTKEEHDTPNNIFNIKDCKILTSDKPRMNVIIIKCLNNDKTTIERVFAASNSKERDEWIEAIQHVSSLLNGHFLIEKSITECQKITLHDFEFLKILGKGTFGKVILCRERFTKRLCAMKILKKSLIISKNEIVHTETENKVMRTMKHPFITSLIYSFQTSDRLCLVMEYVNGGELFFHLTRERRFNEHKSRFYCAEICCAIGFLHSNNIIYRDLKLENILLDCDGHIKLADFGLCKMNMSHGCKTNTFCGTLEYLAPEIFLKDSTEGGYTRAVDWWAVGVVLYEMLVGRLPFCSKTISSSNLNDLNINNYSNKNDFKDLFDRILNQDLFFPNDLNFKSKLILKQLLEKESAKRLGSSSDDFEQIKNHSFFSTIDWDKLINKQIEPPFKPIVSSDTDTCYFESQFTGENVKFTPPTEIDKQILIPNELYYFDSFSYYGSKTSLNSQASHSSKKYQLDKCLNTSFTNKNNNHNFDTQSLIIHDSMSINSNKQFSFTNESIDKYKSSNNSTICPYFLASNAFPNIVRFTDSDGQLLQSKTFTTQLQQGLFYVSSSSSSSLSRSSSILNSNHHFELNDNPIDE